MTGTAQFLGEAGIVVVSGACPEQPLSSFEQGRTDTGTNFNIANRADTPAVEAVVLACTDLRVIESRAVIERELGKPVVTSNLALFNAAMASLGGGGGDV